MPAEAAVARLVSAPRSTADELQPLDDDELTRLLTAISQDRLRVLWLVLLGLGLRRGEALALRWDDFDFEDRTVKTARSLQRVRGDADQATGRRRGRLRELPPKTAASAAKVSLPDTIVPALREHRQDQVRAQLRARIWADDGLGSPA
jgi:integrase